MATRSEIMLATPLDGQHLSWPLPFIVQPKLDGVRCRAVIRANHVTLIGSGGIEIVSMPHIVKELSKINYDIELDGELYLHGKPFAEVSGMARRHLFQEEHLVVEFHVFDIINAGIQRIREIELRTLFSLYPMQSVKRVPTIWVRDADSAMRYLKIFMDEHYEGIILRHPDAPYKRTRVNTLLKFKPRKKDHYLVIGCTEEQSISGNPKGAVGAIICRKDDITFQVGVGPALTRVGREYLWSIRDKLETEGYVAEVTYQNLTAATGTPYQSIVLAILDNRGNII